MSPLIFARRSLPLLLALALGATPALAQEKIGVNTAVNPAAEGTPPGGIVRKLVIGQEVIYNEHIVTGATGQTEILFLDQSALTVGPNAELNIDQFVYDPHTSTGKLVISVEHGLMRYVGGKLSKTEGGVTIRTPTANVGVRGGEILLNVSAGGSVDAVLVYGKELTITGKTGCTQALHRVGYGLSTSDSNGCATTTHAVTSAMLGQYLTQLDGIAGAHAGATTIPTNQTLAQSSLPSTISGNLSASIQAANLNQPLRGTPPQINPAALQTSFQQPTVQTQPAVATSTPAAPSSPGAVSFAATGAAVNSLAPNAGLFFATISYPSASLQNGSFLVTLQNIVQANPELTVNHDRVLLSSVPNLAAFLNGFSGGITLSPLTAGGTNIPVMLSVAGAYNGIALPTSPSPTSTFTLNLGTVASGTATVSPDGQLVTADLALGGPGLDEVFSLKNLNFKQGAAGSSVFLFAGVPTVNLPTVGTGSFSGTAMGTIYNNGATYTATGAFNQSYNFATQAGLLSIANFDGATYTANVTGAGGAFSGTLGGAPGRTGSVGGNFFGPAAKEVGGTFAISGTSGPRYQVGGIFTGH